MDRFIRELEESDHELLTFEQFQRFCGIVFHDVDDLEMFIFAYDNCWEVMGEAPRKDIISFVKCESIHTASDFDLWAENSFETMKNDKFELSGFISWAFEYCSKESFIPSSEALPLFDNVMEPVLSNTVYNTNGSIAAAYQFLKNDVDQVGRSIWNGIYRLLSTNEVSSFIPPSLRPLIARIDQIRQQK
ncbi:hypothetical protein PCE1_000413 [Barthelona sp. PCE]